MLLVVTTVVSYYNYLRVAWYAWMRDPATPEQHDRIYVPLPMRLALFGGAAVVLQTWASSPPRRWSWRSRAWRG